jgi:hypothetical protein
VNKFKKKKPPMIHSKILVLQLLRVMKYTKDKKPGSLRVAREMILSVVVFLSKHLVRERTIPNERPPLVGEVSTELCIICLNFYHLDPRGKNKKTPWL